VNEDFHTWSLREQLEELVRPRPDWFQIASIESGLSRVLPEFASLGIRLPNIGVMIEICRDGRLADHVVIEKGERGVKGLKGDFPQHAAIIELGRRPSVSHSLRQLAALIMACVSEWEARVVRAGRPDQDVMLLARRVENVWRQVRLISDAGIQLLPQISQNASEFQKHLGNTLHNCDPRDADALGLDFSYLQEIQRFFIFFQGGGRLHTTSKMRNEGSLEIMSLKALNELQTDDPDSELKADSVDDYELISRRCEKQVHRMDAYLAGNSPDEFEDEPRFLASVKDIAMNYGGNPVQAAVRLRYRRTHQRRAAQILPGRWGTLNDIDLSTLLLAVTGQAIKREELVSSILILSLLTGRDLDSVLGASVVARKQQLPQSLQASSDIYLITETREWATKILAPESRRRVKSDWTNVMQNHVSTICLPVPPMFWKKLELLVSGRAKQAKKRSVKLYGSLCAKRLKAEAREFLSIVNRGQRSRLTIDRIAYQLTEELQRESKDLIEAVLITGRQPPFGASAALYYHHCDRQRLIDNYAGVMRRWQTLSSPGVSSLPDRQRELIDGSVGSGLVIETPVVAQLFNGLREQVLHDRALLGTMEGRRFFHNSLTNYVLMMTLWLTGYRAVLDPIANASDFNAQRRLLVIADKTGAGYGHSRMVPVCGVLAKQLLIYQSCANGLRNQLSLAARKCRGTFFFYLDKEFNEQEIRPSSMTDFLEWAYVLPLNLNRHWLRGELRRRNVPGPFVDRFMGHWSMGQEPWGRHSSVDPVNFQKVVGDALDALAGELGLQPVEGMS